MQDRPRATEPGRTPSLMEWKLRKSRAHGSWRRCLPAAEPESARHGVGAVWSPASSRSRCRWSGSSRCCSGSSSTLSSITTRRTSSSSASSAAWRSLSAMRRARRPTGAETPASCSCRSRSWRPGGSWACTRFGTAGVLFSESRAGFQVAIPVGLLVSAFFAAGSAFVDVRPELAPRVMRHRAEAPGRGAGRRWPCGSSGRSRTCRRCASRAARPRRGAVLAALAIVGTILYAVSAARYWRLFRHQPDAALGGRDRLFPAARPRR